mmetsp:Transcript_887/g.1085  ORF Transcript_887/g.1085 Transcript_887/m.1085 type:complete len:501 (+) Transcript_887:98-1600(+)
MIDYTFIFYFVLAINLVATFFSSNLSKILCWSKSVITRNERNNANSVEELSRHKKILRNYLIVYLLATLSDWLQGAYVYALYDEYGYSNYEIALLFVAGFGSSMVFGTFLGSMADWGVHRHFILIYTIIYGASCITKHFDDFKILILGRVLAGIATSLLLTVFDAWLIRSHADANLGKEFLSKSFSSAAYGNAIVAIIAGLVANKAAEATTMEPVLGNLVYIGGYLNPFDIALVALILCAMCCAGLHKEEIYVRNTREPKKGDKGSRNKRECNWYDGLYDAYNTTTQSPDILLCGIISSLFEGSMYIFIFMWTPALKSISENDSLPLGLIFSAFMVCCMAGSSTFSILVTWIKDEAVALFVFVTATASMIAIAFGSTEIILLTGMLVFETTIGVYFPVMGILKESIVPEEKRTAIYNLYRIPLNFIVLFALLTDLTPTFSFKLNAIMLSAATILQVIMMKRRLNIHKLSNCANIFQQRKIILAFNKSEEENLVHEVKENV